MKTLELFAGSQSFTKVAKELNCNTFTTDIKNIPGIDYVCDILEFNVFNVPFIPDIIFASPDCATWSKAAGNIHFDKKSMMPKTDKAKLAFKHIEKTLSIIKYYALKNPQLKYYIENPVGKLKYVLQPGTLFSEIPRIITIDQCQYKREFKKPTHIFTNDLFWIPRKRCNGKCEHRPNIKNYGNGAKYSKNTIQNNSYYKRALLPDELCREILLTNLKLHT